MKREYSVTYIFLLSAVQHLSLHPLQKPQLLLATPSVCISALIHFSTFSRPGLLFVWSMTYLDASLQSKKQVSRLHSWDQCQTSFLKNNIDIFCKKRQEYIKTTFFSLFIANGVWMKYKHRPTTATTLSFISVKSWMYRFNQIKTRWTWSTLSIKTKTLTKRYEKTVRYKPKYSLEESDAYGFWARAYFVSIHPWLCALPPPSPPPPPSKKRQQQKQLSLIKDLVTL